MKTSSMLLFVLILVSIGLGGCGARPSAGLTELPIATTEYTPPAPEPTVTVPTAQSTAVPTPGDTPVAEPTGLSLDEFFEVSFRELMLRDPEMVIEEGLAQEYGLEGAELTNISDAYVRETQQMYATVLDVLHTYDRDALTPSEQISYDVYEWYLDDRVRAAEFMYNDYPATYFPVTAVHEQLIQFFTDLHPVRNRQEAEDYVARLCQVDTKFEQLFEGLDLRERAGIVPPRFASQWALYTTVYDMAQADAVHTPFYRAFEEKLSALEDISDEERQALLQDAQVAIDESVLPAYQALAERLEHLQDIGSGDDGVWQFDNGADYYAYTLRHYTTTDMTPDEIHELGLQELDRIHAEMRAIFDRLGYPQDESLVALFDRVARDGGRVSGNQVLDTYTVLIEEAERNLDAAFDRLPQADVVVVADEYGGYYISPSRDGSRSGAFYAGVGGSGEERFAMPTLAYHEAIPGHHLQLALAQELDLPTFRTAVSFTGYAEGWALYAEQLAWELGWYADDPYGDLGRLQAEAFRAARLVVDTGIHAKRWTFDQAVEFMSENVGLDTEDSINPQHQIARYIVWPGQSTAYKIGMLKILELRQRAMDRLGDQFDLKEFHDVVLGNGSMPLEILERVVDDYLEAKLEQ